MLFSFLFFFHSISFFFNNSRKKIKLKSKMATSTTTTAVADDELIQKESYLDMILVQVPLEHIVGVFFPAVEKVLETKGLLNSDLRNIRISFESEEEDKYRDIVNQVNELLGFTDRMAGELIVGAFDSEKNGNVPGRKSLAMCTPNHLRKMFS